MMNRSGSYQTFLKIGRIRKPTKLTVKGLVTVIVEALKTLDQVKLVH